MLVSLKILPKIYFISELILDRLIISIAKSCDVLESRI